MAGQSPSIGCHESSWTAAAAAGVVSNLPAGQLQKALKSCQHLPCLPPLSSSVAKPCPVFQSPLDFCHFSTLSRPSLTHLPSRPAQQLLFMLCHRFCLHFASAFASLSSLFFDNEKCSTRFSLLIYVLARFSYTLALICCCCCCCCCTFLFFCAFSVWVAPLIQFHLSWLHLQLFSMHRCAI